MTTILIQDIPSAFPPKIEEKVITSHALTSEVIIFLSTLCFLAVCGLIRR